MSPRNPAPPHNLNSVHFLRSPLFLICALFIAASALGLRPGMTALADRYRKQTIPLRRKLTDFDATALKTFKVCHRTARLPISFEDVGTEDVLLIDLERNTLRSQRYGVTLLITYYSDPEDKVPHTPEVCYRQMGTTISSIGSTSLELSGLGPAYAEITARVLGLSHSNERAALVYVFCVNGEFCCDRQRVRWLVGRPGDRYVYFSKIEAISPYQFDQDWPAAVERCEDALRAILPQLLREHFPDSAAVKGP